MELAVRNQELTFRVGAISLVVLITLVALMIAYDGCDTGTGFRATIYFGNVGGLQEGAEVNVAGQRIGDVVAISPALWSDLDALGDGPGRRDDEGDDDPARDRARKRAGAAVLVEIAHDRAAMAPFAGEYFIATKGFLGERYLAIGPPRDQGAIGGRSLAEGDRIRGIDPPVMDRVWRRTYRNLLIMRQFLDDVAPEGRAFMTAMSQLLDTASSLEIEPGAVQAARAQLAVLSGEARALYDTVSATELSMADIEAISARAQAALDAAREASAALREPLAALSADITRIRDGVALSPEAQERLTRALDQAERALATLRATVAQANALIASVGQGNGSIGALLNDPEFPEDAKQLGRIIKRHPWRLIGLERDKK